MRFSRFVALAAAVAATTAYAGSVGDYDRAVQAARARWVESRAGATLVHILPPTFAPSQLPEPESLGAALLVRYCVQCHNLPNPAMHDATRWPAIVERMVLRMEGRGNMGVLMQSMMAGLPTPTAEETATLLAYLKKHGQEAIDPARYPDLDQPAARAFKLSCGQCHVLPDPRRHTAREWPAVVTRMKHNMAWMNRHAGSAPDRSAPPLRVDEILPFLRKHAREG